MRSRLFALFCLFFAFPIFGQSSFVNWENAQVHPLDITSDGSTLMAVNTADHRLEVFDITSGSARHRASVPVGLDPVTVRARGRAEAWVVNHISDSISLVDLESEQVVRTLATDDEPADVVFAGDLKAFVSCSQANSILVFDLDDLTQAPQRVRIEGEDPRALAVSPDGSRVYAAIFESGNATTMLGGGAVDNIVFPPNVVGDPAGPWGGVNPPPNDGLSFSPPQNPANPPPPRVGLIVRKNADDRWLDDNRGDWTDLVSGPQAALSGRPVGWDLSDHDIAVVDARSLEVSYVSRLLNIDMALAVNPTSGVIAVVGTDASNEIRYEPVVNGRFVRVEVALVDPGDPSNPLIVDLNPHLTYTVPTIPQELRDLSIGDPRGIVWNSSGTLAYVSGLGSNNLVIIDADGCRAGRSATIEVGEGPTGVVFDEGRSRLYVLNRFASSISVIDTTEEVEIARVPFFDPTPAAIKVGRKHLYDTHKNSGLGHLSCASCHVDARIDRLAWDLGNPAGDVKPFDQNCVLGVILETCEDWHPMKGPMTTQTLQDIIGKEPFHWRGDRFGLEEFNGAFLSLLGDDQNLSGPEMQEFEDFLATIHFPPNPFRNVDNSLPIALPLIGHFTTGRFGPAGLPLPNGNASSGLSLFRNDGLDQGINCVTCHTLPTGIGTNYRLGLLGIEEVPPGPSGELHHAIVSVDGSTNVSIKIPQLRNVYEKVGFEATQSVNLAGFGFLHDGSIDSVARFVTEPVFSVSSVQEVADLVAFLLAFSGSYLPLGDPSDLFELPGPQSKDTHAGVGRQLTFDGGNNADPEAVALFGEMIFLAEVGVVGLVAKGSEAGFPRGYMYVGANTFESDRAGEVFDADDLRRAAGPGHEITFTLVPQGMQRRVGVDRDQDGFFDRDELDACSDPAEAGSVPESGCPEFVRSDCNGDGNTNLEDAIDLLNALFLGGQPPFCDNACDANHDGAVDISDATFTLHYLFLSGDEPAAPFPDCGREPALKTLSCESFASCP